MRRFAPFLLCALAIVSTGAVTAHAADADPKFTVKLSEPGPEGIPPEFNDWKADIQFQIGYRLAVGASDKNGPLPNFIFGQGLCPTKEPCNFVLRVHLGLDSNETPTWQYIQFVLERTDNHKRLEGFSYGQVAKPESYRVFRRVDDAWQELKPGMPEHTEYVMFAGATWDYVQSELEKQNQK